MERGRWKYQNCVFCFIGFIACSLALYIYGYFDHDAAIQKLSCDIVGHKIIVRFSWFIAFAVAVLISFYYFHWFIQFSFSLVGLLFTHSTILSLCIQSGWNVRLYVVDGCVAMFFWFLPIENVAPMILLHYLCMTWNES